jgi:hypothetical protein
MVELARFHTLLVGIHEVAKFLVIRGHMISVTAPNTVTI